MQYLPGAQEKHFLHCVLACLHSNSNFFKILIQTLHKKMVSFQCVLARVFNLELLEIPNPQTLQEYGFIPVWVHMFSCK